MNASSSIAETVRCAAHALTPYSDSPRLDAELLLGQVLGLSRSALLARGGDTIPAECERAYAGLIARRAAGTPVAYLTGSREFWSLPLRVTPAVLVPRPETETLVERTLELKSRDTRCEILDLGTGSGAIALAIASERPLWGVTGVDLSPQALEVAIRNSNRLKLKRIDWRLGCWFGAVAGKRFDLIVANPPYIAAGDPALAKLSTEPDMALCAGATGLEALRAIIAEAPAHLHAGGWLILEHGATQAPDVAHLLKERGFAQLRTHNDFSGRPRVTLGTIHTQH
jgi:release factor glutamine methyltransferase